MTTKELYSKVSTAWVGYGLHKVTVNYRGKEYTCKTHNTLATDRLSEEDGTFAYARKRSGCGLTLREALQMLYDECRRVNAI